MCKFNLYNKEDVKKWILINHPDKSNHPDHDPNITPEIYQENLQILRDCLKDENFCGVPQKKNKSNKEKSC